MTGPVFGAEIIRYFIGFLMLAAGLGKLRTFAQFRANLVTSFGATTLQSTWLAPAVVMLELLAAALVLGPFSGMGMLAALLMLGTFTLVLSYKFFTESIVRCSCFGEAGRAVSGIDLLRNGLVLAAVAVHFMLGQAASLPLTASVLAAALATLLCVVAIELHDIVTLLLGH